MRITTITLSLNNMLTPTLRSANRFILLSNKFLSEYLPKFLFRFTQDVETKANAKPVEELPGFYVDTRPAYNKALKLQKEHDQLIATLSVITYLHKN